MIGNTWVAYETEMDGPLEWNAQGASQGVSQDRSDDS